MPDKPTCFEDDPDYLLARASYLYPDADDPDGRYVARIEAAVEMRMIARRYER